MPPPDYRNPIDVEQRLGDIATRLETLSAEWNEATQVAEVLRAERELEMAKARVRFARDTELRSDDERKAKALVAVNEEQDDLIIRLARAEGKVKGCRAVFDTLDRASSNLQSKLKLIARVDDLPTRDLDSELAWSKGEPV